MELQTITDVSKSYGISARMLRYYENIGLIASLRKDDYAYRVYDDEALSRLRQIIILRKLRVPVKHICVILSNPDSAEAIDIFAENIRELDEEINSLSVIRDVLARLTDALKNSSNIRIDADLLTDSFALSIVETLSLPKTL